MIFVVYIDYMPRPGDFVLFLFCTSSFVFFPPQKNKQTKQFFGFKKDAF